MKPVAISLCFFALVICCSAGNVAAEPATSLKTGVIVPLSGPVAGMGEAFRRGFEFYLDEHPQAAFKVLFEDHKYDGKAAVSALRKLHEIDEVELAIVWGNTPSSSCAPVAEQSQIPLIAVSMNPDARDRKYVASFGPPVEKLIDRVADQFKQWQLKQPAAVSIDIGNALLGVKMLEQRLGGRLIKKTIANEDSDFKTLLSGLKARKVDGILLFAFPEQALTFLRQAAQLQYFPKLVGGDVFADTAFQKQSAELTSQLSFVYGAVDSGFIARLSSRYGSAPYFFETACGYSLAAIVDRLQDVRHPTRENNPLPLLREINISDLPVSRLKLSDSAEYGLHFEADGEVYKVPLNEMTGAKP